MLLYRLISINKQRVMELQYFANPEEITDVGQELANNGQRVKSDLVNKVLWENSHVYSLICCLRMLPHHSDRDHMASKAKAIYYLVLYRKCFLTLALIHSLI